MPNPSPEYTELLTICKEYGAQLLAVSKTRKEKDVLELYKKGQRLFGENRAAELVIKASLLPSDIQWHLIGHLQTNKVKAVIPYVACVQSLDSLKLWQKLDEAAAEERIKIECLLQIKIATEETKYGWEYDELKKVLDSGINQPLENVRITGVMGMASLTRDTGQVRNEMQKLKSYFDVLKKDYFQQEEFNILSMGMSGDYHFALEEGSTMIRIGSLLFD
ncbi:MAG: YggS family pyridoxal phosphate-dependent enzyme [Saprospiraceae bacterium]